jgi:hypothetical protein
MGITFGDPGGGRPQTFKAISLQLIVFYYIALITQKILSIRDYLR